MMANNGKRSRKAFENVESSKKQKYDIDGLLKNLMQDSEFKTTFSTADTQDFMIDMQSQSLLESASAADNISTIDNLKSVENSSTTCKMGYYDTVDVAIMKRLKTEECQLSNSKKMLCYLNKHQQFRLDIRRYGDNGERTEKGVSLDLNQFRKLYELLDNIEEAYLDCLNRGEQIEIKHELGCMIYVTLSYQCPCVDLRAHFIKDNVLLPTKRGCALNLSEFFKFKNFMHSINNSLNEC